MNESRKGEQGFALVTVLFLAALLIALLSGYFLLSHMESATTVATMNSVRGFYAAEAGLNLRAESIRRRFVGYNRPAGVSPVDDGSACNVGNVGAGDFGCQTIDLESRTVSTFVVESPDNPTSIVVPRGELYQNLSAQVYGYDIPSIAWSPADRAEAILEMRFESRLVPLFQFAAFYNKDLEILPGPPMLLNGPVHTNGDLYLDAGNSLDIRGQVTTVGSLYLGRKNSNTCTTGNVAVIDPGALVDLPPCIGGRTQINQGQLAPWNGMVTTGVESLTVPEPDALDPAPAKLYWSRADIRVVLDVDAGNVKIHNADRSVDVIGTIALTGCGAASHSNTFYNTREATTIEMLDVDIAELLDCVHDNLLLAGGRALDDDTEGGLVFYLGVFGPDMNGINNYGVRVFNGAELAASSFGAPEIHGLTVVTNQAVYVQGDYNAIDKRPAAFFADSLNLLSNDWDDADSAGPLADRVVASNMTIHAAFLAGTDTTGAIEGAAGQDLGIYNGGLENYPRFHEDWSGRTLTYRGSFVSLNTPRHVDGSWASQSYSPPDRDWDFDVDFNDAANLPPISPRFVYLRQELFVRDFGL